MASPYPISNRYKVTTADHGQILKLGNAAAGYVGTYAVQFVADAQWSGTLAVVARIDHKDAQDNQVPFVGVPYRRVFLNAAPADRSMGSDFITSDSLIEIPSNGSTVGFLVSCETGFGYLYSKPLDGPAAA